MAHVINKIPVMPKAEARVLNCMQGNCDKQQNTIKNAILRDMNIVEPRKTAKRTSSPVTQEQAECFKNSILVKPDLNGYNGFIMQL